MTQATRLTKELNLKTKRISAFTVGTLIILLSCTGLIISFVASNVLLQEFSIAASLFLSLFLIKLISKH